MTARDFRVMMIAGAALFAMVPLARSEPLTATAVTPDELTWVKGPLAMRAAIAGDDKKSGMYTFRAKFPANFKAEPHYHPDEKINMVISGTLLVGYGEDFNESKMKALPSRQHLDRARKSAAFRMGQGRRSCHSSDR